MCPICRGRGYHILEGIGIIFNRVAICPRCSGMGKVEIAENKEARA